MDLEYRLKRFEEKYHMSSDDFYQKFQSGELGDSIDFFEWNTYYEMWSLAQVKVSELDSQHQMLNLGNPETS